MKNMPFVSMFSPVAKGLSLCENDLIITTVCKKLVTYTHETIVIIDFLQKDDVQLKQTFYQPKFTGEIILSLPREHCILREIDCPHSNVKEFKEALEYQLDSFIPFTNNDVYFDVHLFSHAFHSTKMLIVAVKKTKLDSIMAKLQAINLMPSRVIMSSFAYMPLLENKTGTVVLINKYSDYYSYNLYEDERLVISSIAKSKEILVSQLPATAPEEVLLINIDRNTLPNTYEEIAEELDQNSESYGAALFGLSGYACNLNLVKLKKRYLNQQVILMCFLLGFFIFFVLFIPYIQKINNLAALKVVNSHIKSIKREVRTIENVKERMAILEKAVDSVNIKKDTYIPRIDVILELANLLPTDAWAKALIISNNTFEIEGDAASSTNLIPILEKSPIFSGVGLSSPVIKTDHGKEKFRIKGKILKR